MRCVWYGGQEGHSAIRFSPGKNCTFPKSHAKFRANHIASSEQIAFPKSHSEFRTNRISQIPFEISHKSHFKSLAKIAFCKNFCVNFNSQFIQNFVQILRDYSCKLQIAFHKSHSNLCANRNSQIQFKILRKSVVTIRINCKLDFPNVKLHFANLI